MKYEEPLEYDRDDVEKALESDSIEDLIRMVISVAMFAKDRVWAEQICMRLAKHSHFNVRGNAVLGFGHIARVHGELTVPGAQQVVEKALLDEEEYVRGQAHSAAHDLEHFLGWQIGGNG